MLKLIPYDDKYHTGFKRLNIEWLEQYNLLETHDLEILDDPRGTVINNGGCIFLAIDGEKVIGTAGLWKETDTEFEIIKMAVDPDYRGQGISKLLLDRCMAEAKAMGAKRIFLYSNSQLTTALNLYAQYGFYHVKPTNAPFLTADIMMEKLI